MNRQEMIDMATGAVAGLAKPLADFTAVAKVAGYQGRRGGWIYYDGKAVCQGWQALAARVLDDAQTCMNIVLGLVEAEPETAAPVAEIPRVKVRDIVTLYLDSVRRFEVLEVSDADGPIRIMPMDNGIDSDGTLVGFPKWVFAPYAKVHGQVDKDASYARGMLAEFTEPSSFVTLAVGGLPGTHITVRMALGPSPRMFCGLLAAGTALPFDLALVDCLGCLDAWTAATHREYVDNPRAGTPAQSRL
jgi:hypothetical protein